MLVKHARSRAHERGFTLIELLITLVVVSVGMLGLAKLQAAAVAETQTSRIRSLMTFQAESLAGAMRANRGYWAASALPAPSFILNTTPAGVETLNDRAGANKMTVVTPTTGDSFCVGTAATPVCTPPKMAYDDVFNVWGSKFSKQFPSGSATVLCVAGATVPTTCDITLSWSEHYVVANKNALNGKLNDTVSLVLHVQP
jgi:type IV pilus assembly protein PilV